MLWHILHTIRCFVYIDDVQLRVLLLVAFQGYTCYTVVGEASELWNASDSPHASEHCVVGSVGSINRQNWHIPAERTCYKLGCSNECHSEQKGLLAGQQHPSRGSQHLCLLIGSLCHIVVLLDTFTETSVKITAIRVHRLFSQAYRFFHDILSKVVFPNWQLLILFTSYVSMQNQTTKCWIKLNGLSLILYIIL